MPCGTGRGFTRSSYPFQLRFPPPPLALGLAPEHVEAGDVPGARPEGIGPARRAVAVVEVQDCLGSPACRGIRAGAARGPDHGARPGAIRAAVQAAGHTAGNVAAEAAIAGGITGGGEVVVSTAGEGVRQAAARLFGRLQSRYAQQRANWLARWLEEELMGDLLEELRRGAEAPESAPFGDVEKALESLRDV